MSLIRPMSAMDLLKFNAINLDAFTETYTISYYLNNLSTWPDQFCCVEDTNQNLMGYSRRVGDARAHTALLKLLVGLQ